MNYLLLTVVWVAFASSVSCSYSTEKNEVVLKKLESFVIREKDVSGVKFDELKEAYNESESWDPRIGIRIKRENPKLHCLTRMIVIALAFGERGQALSTLDGTYRLLREHCASGKIGDFTAQTDATNLLIKSLLWDARGGEELGKRMINRAFIDIYERIFKYHSMKASEANKDDILWILQFINSTEIRMLSKFILPIADRGIYNGDEMRDIYTDEMRRRGFLVINHELDYRNKDIDHIK